MMTNGCVQINCHERDHRKRPFSESEYGAQKALKWQLLNLTVSCKELFNKKKILRHEKKRKRLIQN
jgi:hypothetical protein